MLRIPYYSPAFDAGLQIVNLGTGGPASHPHEQATQPKIWPLVYGVPAYGLGAMPRMVLGPTPVIQPGATGLPPQGLLVAGLQKGRG